MKYIVWMFTRRGEMVREYEVLLDVESLSKTFIGEGFEVQALSNVSFQLHAGEMVAVMGTSGSGKSTLLNILGALDYPSSGRIKLNGEWKKEIFSEPAASLYRQQNIGFIFQAYNLLKDLSVEENIALPLILKDIDKKAINSKVDKILDVTGLTDWRKHRPVQLSGGQQQRVAIGRAIITEPPIVLADEPTGNLDFNTSREILRVITDMKRNLNQSILLVTHDPNVATHADRVLFFHDGQIMNEYNCGEPQDLDNIVDIFKELQKEDRQV